MGKVLPAIDDDLARWLEAQPVFFVATAPLAADGLVNCSPKGTAGTFAVLGPHRVAYLDLTGSGIETVSHLQENGRVVLMFCAFAGKPNIVRLHGRGTVLTPDDAGFAALLPRFTEHPGVRAVVVVDVARVADSCGLTVPEMTYAAERTGLDRVNAKKAGDGLLAEYWATRNASSLDGLPGLPGLPESSR